MANITAHETLYNVADYIIATLRFPADMKRDDENACEYDAQTIARGRSIQDWLDSMHDVSAAELNVPEDELQDYLQQYLGYCEHSRLNHYYPK
jgi:hypothetical protein